MGGDVISEIALKLVLPQLLRNCQKLIVLLKNIKVHMCLNKTQTENFELFSLRSIGNC